MAWQAVHDLILHSLYCHHCAKAPNKLCWGYPEKTVTALYLIVLHMHRRQALIATTLCISVNVKVKTMHTTFSRAATHRHNKSESLLWGGCYCEALHQIVRAANFIQH